MQEQPDDRIMKEALGHFLFADNAPAIARAVDEQTANLRAASKATKALLAAIEYNGALETWPSRLELLHSDLLEAHRQTWARVCKVQLDGYYDRQVKDIVGTVWDKVFLNIIIERCLRYSGSIKIGDVTLIRIFGTLMPELANEEIMLTDGNLSCWCSPLRFDGSVPETQSKLPTRVFLTLWNETLKLAGSLFELRDCTLTRAPNILYSFGPIGRSGGSSHFPMGSELRKEV